MAKGVPIKPPQKVSQETTVLFMLLAAAVGALLMHLFDNVRYSSQILQANNQASTAQTTLSKEEYNVKFLINNSATPINCYDLQSDYARGICSTHDHSTSSTDL